MGATRSMPDKRTEISAVPGSNQPASTAIGDLVLAWGRDLASGRPRYILDLGEKERGARCGCVCPACGSALIAVNAAVNEWHLRPHFRHPKGLERRDCGLLAARAAAIEALRAAGEFVLPRRERSATAQGLGGGSYTAWVKSDPLKIHISEVEIVDAVTALLVLADGSRLHVRLTGSVEHTGPGREDYHAAITIDVNDSRLAAMSPQELLQQLQLLADSATWRCHWLDAELDRQAMIEAQAQAVEALDWDGRGEPVNEHAARERRESLLHAEVKCILAKSGSIAVPAMSVEVSRAMADGSAEHRRWVRDAARLKVHTAVLERRIGRTVPDVVASVGEKLESAADEAHLWTLLVEVTVTNPITDERLERIRVVGLPTLEIDLSMMGGRLKRSELAAIVVDGLAGKRWLHHQQILQQRNLLEAELAALPERHPQQADYGLGPLLDDALDERERRRIVQQARRNQNFLVGVEAAISEGESGMTKEAVAQRFVDCVIAQLDDHMRIEEFELDGKTSQDTIDELRVDHARLAGATRSWALGLAKKGYPEALDEGLYFSQGSILSRLLSIKLDRGVGYRLEKAWNVLNAIMQDQAKTAIQWHTLYLIAVKVYKPDLRDKYGNSSKRERSIENWRTEMIESIDAKNFGGKSSPYERLPTLDRLLALLLPEMAAALAKPFGKRLSPPEARGQASRRSTGSGGHLTAHQAWAGRHYGHYLEGAALEAWLAGKTPEEASYWREFLRTTP